MSKKKKRALEALLREPTVSRAAQTAGISERTLYRYMTDPDFQAAMVEAQGGALRTATIRLTGLLQKALDVIGLDFEPGVDGKLRLTAAGLVLRHVQNILEYADLERRVAILEQASKRGEQ